MRRPTVHEAAAASFLVLGFVAVIAWSSSWPVAPLIPDEAMAKVMADSVKAHGTPLAREPLDGYPNGIFAVEQYGAHYRDHALVDPPVSVAVAFEQGLVPVQAGRAFTLAVGLVAIAILAWRMDGPLTAVLAGAIYLTHPAVLYFHQSYFANPGGVAWFLATLALLEASRDRTAFAALAVATGALALAYRIEYGIGMLAVLLLAPVVGPLRRGKAALAFYALTALGLGFLVWGAGTVPTTDLLPAGASGLREAALHPVDALRDRMSHYLQREEVVRWGRESFDGHARDYFLWFFPLTTSLALVGLFVQPRDAKAAWVFAPIAIQCLVMAVAILPVLVNFDFSNKSWLESSVVRYFLPLFAASALLAALPLAAVVRLVSGNSASRSAIATGFLVLGLGAAGIAQALQADHGVAWANERREWFSEIDGAAASLGKRSVFIGVQPSKIIFERPVLSPANLPHDPDAVARIAKNLIERGHQVYALDPWFYADAGPYNVAAQTLGDGHAYWADTRIVVDCACGEQARFWRLHVTNATLSNVERLDAGAWAETSEGLVTTGSPRSFFWPVRELHAAMGSGSADAVRVTFEVLDEHPGRELAAGHVNVPTNVRENLHVDARWTGLGSDGWIEISFEIPRGTVVNGPLFLSDGWTVRRIQVAIIE